MEGTGVIDAPCLLVEANDEYHAPIKVAKTICEQIGKGFKPLMRRASRICYPLDNTKPGAISLPGSRSYAVFL